MRKLIVLSFISLDGVMQAPGGPEEDPSGDFRFGGWSFPHFDEELGAVMDKQLSVPFELLLGRKTYDIFASYWPENDSNWPGVNEVRKYVASNTLQSPEWQNSVVLSGDVPGRLRELKQQKGPDLQVHGSGNLVQTLLREDLVDELWLKTFPVLLGSGRRLFGDGTMPSTFTLIDSQVTPSGVVVANYARAGKVETGSFA